MLLSLVAHVVGYKTIVGAHNTIDAQRHIGRALPYLSGMGVDDAHNIVGENIGAYNTAWVLARLEGCRAPF